MTQTRIYHADLVEIGQAPDPDLQRRERDKEFDNKPAAEERWQPDPRADPKR